LQSRPPPTDRKAAALLGAAFAQLIRRTHGAPGASPASRGGIDDALCPHVVGLYRHLGAANPVRHQLLVWLAASRSRTSLAALADTLVEDPPSDATAVATSLSPLFQRRDYDPQAVFPRLLDGLNHSQAGSAILDLASFVARAQLTTRHPAADRVEQLAALLGGVVGRLGRLESAAGEAVASGQQRARQVDEGVALAISLCDALALIGQRSIVGKLYQAMELSHRRLRTEAAAALARLGERTGADTLVALAAEPVVRLRVLAYAEELGLLDKVEETYQTPQARAEAELSLWLAQPSQMGFPPTECQLIEARELYWPGYDEPVTCWLFRFVYRFGDQEFSNVGAAGPLVHAFGADLLDLPPDDIFAAFAGWQAEHQEIWEVEISGLDEPQRVEVFRLRRRLQDSGYEAVQPVRLGLFFGAKVLIARATRSGQPGVAVADRNEIYWLPTAASRRPPGPDEAYCIFKGRRLLRAFNP
jgi:hypothetical protein